MNNNIKWASIQPLTGGMYIGAELAIGHPAEFILSYEGLDSISYDKDGNIKSANNEYNLIEYLKKHNRLPKYYKFKRKLFSDNIYEKNPVIMLDDKEETPDYSDLDIVVAVPVYSGLSMATSATSETKEARNCNMLWLAYYTLNVIRPKVYCFENAPTLMGSRGDDLRNTFENMAQQSVYSVLYYKTNTCLHGNPQNRPRTFVIFTKHTINGVQNPSLFMFENNQISAVDFFNTISENLPQSEKVKTSQHNSIVLSFIKEKLGEKWTNVVNGAIMNYIVKNKLFDELLSYTKNLPDSKTKEKALKYFEHIKYKKEQGLNYYADDICLFKDKFPAVQFRMIPNMLHPSGERMCTIREYLSLMGMPEDFILYGNTGDLPKIGQNVPVHTAEFIVKNIVNIINNWNEPRQETTNIVYQNNINQQTIKL